MTGLGDAGRKQKGVSWESWVMPLAEDAVVTKWRAQRDDRADGR